MAVCSMCQREMHDRVGCTVPLAGRRRPLGWWLPEGEKAFRDGDSEDSLIRDL